MPSAVTRPNPRDRALGAPAGKRPIALRPTGLRLVACVLAACAATSALLPSTSAGAAETPTTSTNQARGPEALTWTGKAIRGSSGEDGPTLPQGDSLDTLQGDELARNYQIKRTVVGSTLRVAVVTESGKDGGEIGVTGYSAADPDVTCPSSGDSLSQPGLLSSEIVLEPTGDCGALGSFRVELEGRGPIGGASLLLRFTEEPPLTSIGTAGRSLSSLAEAPAVRGEKRPVIGGTNPSTTPAIGPGRWSSALVPGETRLYRIPMAYGESLRVGVLFGGLTTAQQNDLETSSVGATISLLDPMLGRLDPPDGASTTTYSGEATLFTGTGSVNRGIDQVVSSGSTDLAGNYYLVVSAAEVSGKSIELPITLDVAVLGERVAGPTYTGNEAWTVTAHVTPVTGEDLTGGERQAVLGETSQKRVSVVSIASGAAGLALIMGGVSLLLRRRRSPAR